MSSPNLSEHVQPRVRPEDVGLSTARLEHIGELLDRHQREGRIAGASLLVVRRGALAYARTLGACNASHPMSDNAIFRIHSMTKALTSVVALRLYEDGDLLLGDPVAKYLPELGNLNVVVPGADGADSTIRPARAQMTVWDLLCHTSGIAGATSSKSPVTHLYAAAGIRPFEHTEKAYQGTTQDLVTALGKLPLAHEPGTVWEYGRSGDVLGRVVEVAAGAPLDVIIDEKLCKPLGLHDTGFWVEPSHADRVAQPRLQPTTYSAPAAALTSRPTFISGGTGAYSTTHDFLRFLTMLLNGGELDGRRLLSRRTVELMTADHLGPLAGSGPDYIPGPGYGFGFGVAVRLAVAPCRVIGSVGEYGWLGRGATSFLVAPDEQLIAILMMQEYGFARYYQSLFRTLVWQAVTD